MVLVCRGLLHVLMVLLLLVVRCLLLVQLLRRRWRWQRLLAAALRPAEHDARRPDAGQHAHLVQVAVCVAHVRGRVMATAGQQARTVFYFGVH